MRSRCLVSARMCRVALVSVLLLVAALRLHVSVSREWRAAFPAHSADYLAHYLADFSHHPQLYLHPIKDWVLLEERNNYTSWMYDVRYACGAQCGGSAGVSAHQQHAAPIDQRAHQPATPASHTLTLTHTYCSSAPILLWINFCDEITVTARVEGSTQGSVYWESVHASCGLGSWTSGACEAALNHRQRQLLRLASGPAAA